MGVSRRPGDGGAGRPASRTAFASTEERTVLVRVAARYGGFPVRPLGRGFDGLREGARHRPGSGDRPRDPPRNSASGDRIADYAARHRRGAGVGGGGHREGVPVLRRLAPPAVAPARPDAGTRRRTDAAAAHGPGGRERLLAGLRAAESGRPRRGTHLREFLPSGEVDGLSIFDLGAVGRDEPGRGAARPAARTGRGVPSDLPRQHRAEPAAGAGAALHPPRLRRQRPLRRDSKAHRQAASPLLQ